MMLRRLLILVVVLAGIFAGEDSYAQDGLALMKVEVGARPAGMGGAFVSIPGDPNGTVYNPALAIGPSIFTTTLGYNTFWENIDIGNVHFIYPTKRLFIHGGIRYAGVGNIEGRQQPTQNPDQITDVDARDVSFKVGFSYLIQDNFSVGFAAGWFMEKIDIWRGSVFNYDMGVYFMPKDRISVGASVTNLGQDFQLTQNDQVNSRDIPVPTSYRIGGSYTYDRYLGALDLVIIDDDAHLHAGAEAQLHESFAARAGWMIGYDSKNTTAGASFTKRNFTFDYAFVPYTRGLGSAHMFNLTVSL